MSSLLPRNETSTLHHSPSSRHAAIHMRLPCSRVLGMAPSKANLWYGMRETSLQWPKSSCPPTPSAKTTSPPTAPRQHWSDTAATPSSSLASACGTSAERPPLGDATARCPRSPQVAPSYDARRAVPIVTSGSVHILVDYDNVDELNRRRGLLDLVTTMLDTLPERATPDNVIADIRLYGGWYEQDRPTSLAQKLLAEIALRFPAMLHLGISSNQRRIRAVVDLARSLLIRPDTNLLGTFRHRRGAPRLRSTAPPYTNCAAPDDCSLRSLHALLRGRRCPAETCHAELRDAFWLPQQKLVDTMLTADAIYVAGSSPSTKLAIVSNDVDLWPCICTAGHLGAIVYHVHPQRGRKTPDLYLTSAPPKYSQYSF